MSRWRVAVVAAVLLALLGIGVPDAGTTDVKVYARTAVPDETRKVGEVKLLQRDGATVVETVLVTKVIERVVAEIRQKDERGWPPGSDGRDDMERYTAALAEAARTLRARMPPADARNANDASRRARLLIDFRATADKAEVELAEFDSTDAAPFEPTVRRSLTILDLDRAYVLRNMRLILADSFHLPENEVATLGPLGPAALP